MKIGICGRGPWAIELGLSILEKGGHVRFYGDDHWGADYYLLQEENPQQPLLECWEQITTPLGRRLAWEEEGKGPPSLEDVPTARDYWQEYLWPLVEKNQLQRNFLSGRILRVQKRFLHPQEGILNRTRFLDLFRIVLVKSPEGQGPSESGDLSNVPEVMQEVMENIQEDYEVFDDVDVVVHALSDARLPNPMGAGGCLALGESRAQTQARIHYLRPWTKASSILDPALKTLAFVGSSQEIRAALGSWSQWVLGQANPEDYHAYHVTYHAPWSFSDEKLESFFKDRMRTFLEQKEEWDGLEDYIKVKKKRPQRPLPLYQCFSGFDVVSVDQLLDREGLYLTIERPDFREQQGQANAEEDSLKTLKVDRCLVGTGFRPTTDLYETLQTEERGFFRFEPTASMAAKLKQQAAIFEGLFSLFSPRRMEPHEDA